MIGRSTPLLTFCSTSGGAGSDALMPLTIRPTGLGAGIDKDRPDFTVEPWRVNSPFSSWREGLASESKR